MYSVLNIYVILPTKPLKSNTQSLIINNQSTLSVSSLAPYNQEETKLCMLWFGHRNICRQLQYYRHNNTFL